MLCAWTFSHNLTPHNPYNTYNNDTLKVVMSIAHKGVMGAAARDCLGKDPGKAVHVVLPDRENHGGNIGDFGVASDAKDGGCF